MEGVIIVTERVITSMNANIEKETKSIEENTSENPRTNIATKN